MTDYAIIREGEIQRFADEHDVEALPVGLDAAYPERPYLLPIELTDPAYDPIIEVKEGPVDTLLSDRVTRVFTVRAKNVDEVGAMKADKISAIHALGDLKLETEVTLREQVHALTDIVQVLYTHADMSGWTGPELTLVAAANTKLDRIQYIRNYEEVKIAEVTALADDPAIIDAYNIQAGWEQHVGEATFRGIGSLSATGGWQRAQGEALFGGDSSFSIEATVV